jgi:hypothetical protein
LHGPAPAAAERPYPKSLFPLARAIVIDLAGRASVIDGDTVEIHGNIACENALLDSR